jgi:hypothetical protein
MEEPELIVTTLGRQRIARAVAEDERLKIATVRLSSVFAQANDGRTSLTKLEESFAVAGVEDLSGGRIYIEALPIPERTYEVREVGIFLEDGTMIAIAASNEDPLLFAIRGQKVPLTLTITIAGLKDGVIQVIESDTRLNLSVAEEFARLAQIITSLQSLVLSQDIRIRELERRLR